MCQLKEIPQYILEAGIALQGQAIAVTQPRRVAAINLAKRVADEVGTPLGQKVRNYPYAHFFLSLFRPLYQCS